MSRFLGTALLAALVATPAAAASEMKRWIDGPIRYILRAHEAREFRALSSDDDRALFIEKFWSRRDPSPETLSNEYRQMFWERVQQTKTMFTDSAKPGWKTDRGKIFILYGPPTEIQDHAHLETDSLAGGSRGVIRWLYVGGPAQRDDLGPMVIVPFARDPSGEYRLTYDPELASIFFDPTRVRDRQSNTIERWMSNIAGSSRSELAVALDLGKMQEVPPQEEILIERVETMETYRSVPAPTVLSRYRDPDRAETLVVVTVDLTAIAQTGRPSVVARFTPRDATRKPRLLGEDAFRLERREDRLLGQGRLGLGPGVYDVTVLAIEPNSVATGLFRGTLDVGQVSSPGPRSSDVVWAHDLESLPYAAMASYVEPFHVGGFAVYPRFDADFRPGDTPTLFYEVYDAVAPYRVTYRLEGRDLDGSWVALGRATSVDGQTAPGQGWELETSPDWPDGEYRIRIEVLDAEDRGTAAEIPFRLAGPDPS